MGHSRENKSIPIEPVRILRVEPHELVEENVCCRGQAHWGARMTRIGFNGGINLSFHLSKAEHHTFEVGSADGGWGW